MEPRKKTGMPKIKTVIAERRGTVRGKDRLFTPPYRKAVFYTAPAKRILGRNRQEEIFRAFLEARKSKAEVFQPSPSSKIKITRLKARGSLNSGAWRVDVGNVPFFVKETDPKLLGKRHPGSGKLVLRADLGPRQFLALRKLKEFAKDFPHIEIAEPQFAWLDQDKSFLATRFYDLERMDSPTIRKIPGNIRDEFVRFGNAVRKSGIHDIGSSNALYDEKLNKIVIITVFDPRWFDDLDNSLHDKRGWY